ncbi:hypothetical protein ALP51_200135 [Pseudomonas savastanoi]|uniref:Uncharacterized protein n=1 Tax=Pseudomonas savastanoi TaxID=29438 RepID=A0A3M5JCT0_PSESS|nr:hypothetical protein ALP51_200135 [Pseudomonas savastanoi]
MELAWVYYTTNQRAIRPWLRIPRDYVVAKASTFLSRFQNQSPHLKLQHCYALATFHLPKLAVDRRLWYHDGCNVFCHTIDRNTPSFHKISLVRLPYVAYAKTPVVPKMHTRSKEDLAAG